MKSRYENYTRSMAKIIRDLLAIDSNKMQSRVEIRSRWMLRHPEHAKPYGHKYPNSEKGSRGTVAKNYIQHALKDLESRGVVKRVNDNFIKVLDVSQIIHIANWGSNEES